MTLGGLLKHMAFVEDWWLQHIFAGEPMRPTVRRGGLGRRRGLGVAHRRRRHPRRSSARCWKAGRSRTPARSSPGRWTARRASTPPRRRASHRLPEASTSTCAGSSCTWSRSTPATTATPTSSGSPSTVRWASSPAERGILVGWSALTGGFWSYDGLEELRAPRTRQAGPASGDGEDERTGHAVADGELADQREHGSRWACRDFERDLQGATEVEGVYDELEDPRRQVVLESHPTGDRRHQLCAIEGVQQPHHARREGRHRRQRILAQGASGFTAALGDAGPRRCRLPSRAVVVGGRTDLDDVGWLRHIRLDSHERATGVTNERAHVPFAEPGFVPPITDEGDGVDEPRAGFAVREA